MKQSVPVLLIVMLCSMLAPVRCWAADSVYLARGRKIAITARPLIVVLLLLLAGHAHDFAVHCGEVETAVGGDHAIEDRARVELAFSRLLAVRR